MQVIVWLYCVRKVFHYIVRIINKKNKEMSKPQTNTNYLYNTIRQSYNYKQTSEEFMKTTDSLYLKVQGTSQNTSSYQ